jgi:hypothetical protein
MHWRWRWIGTNVVRTKKADEWATRAAKHITDQRVTVYGERQCATHARIS